jgi:aspartyl-tRNA(Asn)/glutamyl-tRNA(Gln) amidotransferase subunit A
MTELVKLSLSEQLEGLKTKSFSSKELTEAFLKEIKSKSSLNTFISVYEEEALKNSSIADKNLSNNRSRILEGIPIAHKDIFCIENKQTTCGSKMLENFISPYSSEVYSKLNNLGAITLGKTNMDEFAMGSSNETSYFGKVFNPIDKKYSPGGSSGGSAAAVRANQCSFATGTDTGGSIRQPASFCGVTGIKPTYGRVSRWGMIAFASSLDQGGILAKNAEDAALALHCISGFDEKDSTSLNEPVGDYINEINSKEEHVLGIPKILIDKISNNSVKENFNNAIEILKEDGVKIKEIDLPHIEYSLPAYYVIAPAECSANLARYDGIRFGHRSEHASSLEELYFNSRTEGFGKEVKNRIFIGTFCLSAGYFDAFYKKALRIRRLIKSDFDKAFKKVSSIAMPTCANTSFKLGSINSPVEMYEQDVYTIPANLAGLPAISIPSGIHNKMPLGIQFLGNYLDEGKILNLANKFQNLTDFHEYK